MTLPIPTAPSAPKITQKKTLGPTISSIRPSINQKINKYFNKYFNKDFRYTEDGSCAYCGLGPNNPLPTWPKNWQCCLTHSDDDPKLAKYPALWTKICAQGDYVMQ